MAAGVLIASLAVDATWPWRWWSMVGSYEAVYPLSMSIGYLLPLSGLWFRRRKARLLFVTAFMPFRGVYDLLPLALIPNGTWQMCLWVVGSWVFPFAYGTGYGDGYRVALHVLSALFVALP